MKVSNNNISFAMKVDTNKRFFITNEREDEKIKSNTIQFNMKKDKNDKSDFLKLISTRNKELQERMDELKLRDLNHLMDLEERENTVSKNIKDFCEKNRNKFSQWAGISNSLDDLLSGNVDSVLNTMNSEKVSMHINNLQVAVVLDDLSGLKDYYSKHLDSNEDFIEYRKNKGEDSTFDLDKLPADKKEEYCLLKSLKEIYGTLFKIDDAIKNFKKESNERFDEMIENFQKLSGNFKSTTTAYYAVVSENSKTRGNNRSTELDNF